MHSSGLTFKEIFRNPFRSVAVTLCALLVAGFSLAAFLIASGTADSLEVAEQRFGADLIVVPMGAERETKGALLMAVPMRAWMPAGQAQAVAAVPGVASASPQLYVGTVGETPGSALPPMFLVAFDPATDFAIQPWSPVELGEGLHLGECVAGSLLPSDLENDSLGVLGYELSLKTRLRPTGTSLDETLLVSFETARGILESTELEAQQGFTVPADSISSILVKVSPGADVDVVAAAIRKDAPGVSPITSPELFGSFRAQMRGQQTGMLAILGVVLALSLAVLVLVFSMVVNERRREIGVLRALGSTRAGVLRSLLSSAAVLAFAGGVAGIVLSGLVLYFFRNALTDALGFPFLFPSMADLVVLVVIGLAIALGAVLLAASVPAYRISRQDPAISMRE